MRLFLALLAALLPASALAQTVVTSSAPDSVAVTIYRDEQRGAESPMQLERLGGYALITETRTVDLPAGTAVIRFEGVAGGMLPESALVTGLPKGVREKNLDADLLTPRSLYARSTGRPVTLRRTHRETGEMREEPAVIRSGIDGSVIVQTKDGFEAANCGPLSEALSWSSVPEGLSAKPTLSVETQADAPARVTLSLSYLAWGFDWQANYVVYMQENGRKADMLAWVTLANSDPTSFAQATTAVVGGTVNRKDTQPYQRRRGSEQLLFQCFFRPASVRQAINEIYESDAAGFAAPGEIIVTARRVEKLMDAPVAITVIEEQLGDLKLYRVPMPTTVASKAQKQVALFQREDVQLDVIYAADVSPNRETVEQRLRTKNRKREGLGLALPAGGLTVFEPHDGRPVLSGEGVLRDSAVGQDVEVRLGEATQVSLKVEKLEDGELDGGRDWAIYRVAVSNANPFAIAFEGKLQDHLASDEVIAPLSRGKVEQVNGRPVWKVTVPANSIRILRYRVTEP